MGTSLENPDITVALDSSSDTAFLRLDVDIVIPRHYYLELAILLDRHLYAEAETLMLELRPDAAPYLRLFFGKRLRELSDQAAAA